VIDPRHATAFDALVLAIMTSPLVDDLRVNPPPEGKRSAARGLAPSRAASGGPRPAHGRAIAGSRSALSWLVPVGLLFVWEAAARVGLIESSILPRPSSVLATAARLLASGELQGHFEASMRRVVLGFVLGTSVGAALGVLVGLSKTADTLLDRSLQMIRAVPFLAIMPLVVVWLGIGEASKVLLVGLATMFPLYLNTVLGIRQVDGKLLEMARVFGVSRLQQIRWIVLPGALPSVLNGVRLSLTTGWLAIVAAETMGASEGIGFLATNAREFLQTDVMVLVIVLYALIGIASDLSARILERRLLAWHPSYAAARL
jgi:sulfonate transport system permease protein